MRKFWINNQQSSHCSSYNMGLPLKIWLRICSTIGMVSAILYIISGTTLISHISQHEKATFSAITYSEKTRHIYYKRNAEFFIGIAVVLILINFVQLCSDAMLFHSTLKITKRRSLWLFFSLDVILWVLTLVCFVTIFSGGGLFLLLVFLFGTAIRLYIVFILHEFMNQESKVNYKTQSHNPVLVATTTESGRPSSNNGGEDTKLSEPINLSNTVIMEVEETEVGDDTITDIINKDNNDDTKQENVTDDLKTELTRTHSVASMV